MSSHLTASARNSLIDFTKKCHCQSHHFICRGHTRSSKTLPRAFHVCNCPYDANGPCNNMISQHKIIEANELCPKYKFEGIIKDRNTEEQRVESVNKTNEGNAIRDKLEEAEAEERRGSSWRPLTDEPPKAGGAEGKKKQGGKTAQQADIQGVQDSMIESLRKNVELLSIEDDFSSYREQDPDKSAPADTSEEVAASESSDVSYKTLENNQQDKPLGGDVVESIGSWVKLDKAPAEEGWVDVETGFDWEDNYAGEQIAAKKTWWTW